MTDDRNAFAKRHLGLVHACCKRFSDKGIEYEELYAAGCLGLSKAIDRFDESLGYCFSTYAFPVIMGEIKRLFRDGGSMRVSRSIKELGLKISRLQNSGELTVSQLAEKLGVEREKVAEAIAASQATVSLSACDGEEDSCALEIPAPDFQAELTERLSLRSALRTLDDRDRRMIELRYFQNQTQTQTARRLNMTQVQVSRREKKLLSILRQQLA